MLKRTVKDFNDLNEFKAFLSVYPEVGQGFPKAQINIPYDVSHMQFDSLNSFTISFNPYEKFYLLMHRETNEIYLGNINTGGHGARCRIIKFERADIFYKPDELKGWYKNWSWNMWK